ncbi:hypothetical protein JCM9140_786 [Halalkalibacter wakoensis JCM 9140]|uniref:Uncharacterized protein n=1 Tax=Halalkalibacter wakoensis JCM 9140 TaxID=1236970 RepID=W4PZB7_9BACI|nr:hypothetical protein [Halalkalibacter wakoensis]GAE24833.1 hypothetical protein JCM9140_786 [Halalkalibacter wakoensis JCM 9140]
MKKGTKIWMVLAVLLLIIGFLIPINVEISGDTRVIIDHTLEVYSVPSCYDQADLTNNLEETTLSYAKQLNYMSESSCTEEQLQESKPFLIGIFQ